MANITGMDSVVHPVRDWGDRLVVPDKVMPFYWQLLPTDSVWSAPQFNIDFVSVGQRDFSVSESIRSIIPGFNDGTTDFIAQGFVDIQGWLIQDWEEVGGSLGDITPNQVVQDYVRKIANPKLDANLLTANTQEYTADQQLVTPREAQGPDYTQDEDNRDDAEDRNADGRDVDTGGEATSVPAIIDMGKLYDFGPSMFFENRVYLGMRHDNAMPVGEQKQRYAGNIRTSIDGIKARGKFSVVIFTTSMPLMHAGGTPFDEADEKIAPFTDWDEMLAMYQNAPLGMREMIDDVGIHQAARQFQLDAQGDDGQLRGLWGPDSRFDEYIQSVRRYYVKPETWVQLPLLISNRINAHLTVPFTLAPQVMPT